MTVWVVEQGLYDECMVTGIYATADAAKAAQEGEQNWTWQEELREWRNDEDWGDRIAITEYEVKS